MLKQLFFMVLISSLNQVALAQDEIKGSESELVTNVELEEKFEINHAQKACSEHEGLRSISFLDGEASSIECKNGVVFDIIKNPHSEKVHDETHISEGGDEIQEVSQNDSTSKTTSTNENQSQEKKIYVCKICGAWWSDEPPFYLAMR
jgi:hypothetical protein